MRGRIRELKEVVRNMKEEAVKERERWEKEKSEIIKEVRGLKEEIKKMKEEKCEGRDNWKRENGVEVQIEENRKESQQGWQVKERRQTRGEEKKGEAAREKIQEEKPDGITEEHWKYEMQERRERRKRIIIRNKEGINNKETLKEACKKMKIEEGGYKVQYKGQYKISIEFRTIEEKLKALENKKNLKRTGIWKAGNTTKEQEKWKKSPFEGGRREKEEKAVNNEEEDATRNEEEETMNNEEEETASKEEEEATNSEEEDMEYKGLVLDLIIEVERAKGGIGKLEVITRTESDHLPVRFEVGRKGKKRREKRKRKGKRKKGEEKIKWEKEKKTEYRATVIKMIREQEKEGKVVGKWEAIKKGLWEAAREVKIVRREKTGEERGKGERKYSEECRKAKKEVHKKLKEWTKERTEEKKKKMRESREKLRSIERREKEE
ncbi:hypothetical protein PV327_011300 [Microctonus hyperodae]|uniref:Uncharacterized protein n=1 Tax=Microctonus hyperodae TaxID=165561 RepID=A0AA39C3I8_MICHY|nr:hypothetical protein PV327_011300 [Microctonus hyperodae]